MSWQCISLKVTVKVFKRCCTFSAVDGTDNDMLWNGRRKVGKVRSECAEGEGTGCEDGDSDTDW
jgi:hypothetical protein